MHEQKQKIHIKAINLNYQDHHEMKNINYLIDNILYHIFKIILSIPLKNMKKTLLIHR